jgi:outer membrane protein assembly factor BamB/mono/diheme cytochrome c family protein
MVRTGLAADADWPLVGGAGDGQRFSSLKQINRQNIARLSGAWVSEPFDDGASSRVTPVVERGRLYLSAGVRIYALDAGSGKTLWKRALGSAGDAKDAADLTAFAASDNPLPNAQGLALGEGLIFAGTANGSVVALDQRNGNIVWSVGLRDNPPHPMQNVSAAPVYTDGMVFVSLTTVERLRGRVMALDAHTGRELWRFYVVPDAGDPGSETWPNTEARKNGGGNVWLPPAVDSRLGLVYFGTGNAAPIRSGDLRPGNNLYTASVIALDEKTGRLRWHYQLVHHDLWEMDVATPLLVVRGPSGPAIVAMRPDGMLFRLDAATGRPLSRIEERPVTQEVEEATSPTQPFPIGTDSIVPACDSYRTTIPAGFVLDCNLPPPSYRRLNVLGPEAGVRVNPMSYSSQSGYLYALGNAYLTWRRRSEDPLAYDLIGFSDRVPGLEATSSRTLAAIDIRTGKIAWSQSTPGAGSDVGSPSGAGGGLLTTAGGLLFRRNGEGTFLALDAKTGKTLWHYWTGAVGGSASPISYAARGQQYVAVIDNTVVRAFTLGGPIAPAAVPATPSAEPSTFFSGSIQDAKLIELVSLRQENPYLTGTRYTIDEYAPNPYRARVAGLTVTFGNNGHQTHTIVGLDGSWTTGPLEPGQTADIRFPKAGSYGYRCQEHPFTYGEVIVGATPDQRSPSGLASEAGAQIYKRDCASCHGANLAGGDRGGVALVGTSFMTRWHGKTARDLLVRIRATMPATAPGSLEGADYLAVTDYLLQANGLDEQAKDEEGLALIKFGDHP